MKNPEILTFQLGPSSNFVGAHWWNIQNQTTFTPRLIAVDYRENVGSRNLSAGIYDGGKSRKPALSGSASQSPSPESEVLSWEGKCVVAPQDESFHSSSNPFLADLEKERTTEATNLIEKRYYDLDSVVRQWTDILKVPYHPRSLTTVPFEGKETQKVTKFEDGLALFDKSSFSDSFEDKIRKFVEESDFFQGVHMIYDVETSFSGVSAWIHQHLTEEYRKTPILACPVFHTCPSSLAEAERHNYLWNTAQSLSGMDFDSSLYLPLSSRQDIWSSNSEELDSFPFLQFNKDLLYHTSGVLAVGLETATSSWRLIKDPDSLRDIINHLKSAGSPISSLGLCLPLGISKRDSLSKHCADLMAGSRSFDIRPLSPSWTADEGGVGRFSLRGMKSLDFNSDLSDNHEFRRLTTPAEVLFECLKRQSSDLSLYVGGDSVHTTAPFPHIFSPQVSECGLIAGCSRPDYSSVKSVPTLTRLASSPTDSRFIQELIAQLEKLNHRLLRTESDYFDEILSKLLIIKGEA